MQQAIERSVSPLVGDEKTLDPRDEAGWADLRAIGHEMLDGIFDHMQDLRSKPVWAEMPARTRDALKSAEIPRTGKGVRAAYEAFSEHILPYATGNAHPRFFGWVQGGGTPLGMLADMLASGLNPHMAGFNQAPALVEDQVIAWLAELMGMPAGTSGLLTSGGSMANLLALVVARDARAGFDMRGKGVSGGEHLRLYCSTETHSWVKKATAVMGMGSAGLASIAVDSEFRIDLLELRRQITLDRRAGLRPICVIGTAGTVNTGASDDLAALADLCAEEGLWFHVDGAFGGLAYWSEQLRPAVRGLERADSVAFDLHKWGYLPFEVGCVLVRDAEAHTAAFRTSASYLQSMERGPAVGRLEFADRGIELTRGFKALKVWMSLVAYGTDLFVTLIEQNVQQARRLAELVESEPELELMAPVPLNIVCFGYRGATDAGNREILLRLQESGIALPSSTVVGGRFALRAANVNHRTRLEDLEIMVAAVVRIGRDVVSGR